ncbi:MAG: rhomboid family intramembrane serine protease [Chthoniobacterales bacterium]
MIDLNHILLFIAIASPLILLVRIARLRNPRNHGWRIAASVVLAICAIAWFFAPSLAGYVGGTFWCLLLVIPSLAERQIDDALLGQHFARARQIAIVRQILHPWNDSPHRPSIVRCLELAANGRLDLALDQLAAERTEPTPSGRFASALTFALTENWAGLVQWCRRDLSVVTNPAVDSLYLRGLGEIGALDDLVFEVAARTAGQEPDFVLRSLSGFNLALVLAFSGRTALLVRLFRERLGQMAAERQQFWIATAEWAAGKHELARPGLEKLRAGTRDAVLRRSIDRRLATGPGLSHFSASGETVLARLVAETISAQETAARPRSKGAPAVWALILLNVAMFGMEIMLGGSTNTRTLDQLGALEPDAVIIAHEYWRLLTALFLHYGVLHISFNLYALYLLGPELERMIGSFKFTISYLIAGLGSSAGVVLLYALKLTQADQLVGASGCVMGVIGVSAGLLLRHRQSPLAGRRLRNIIIIVVLQTAFDLSTPQVSLSAHLSGFVTGVVVGVILASQERRTPW